MEKVIELVKLLIEDYKNALDKQFGIGQLANKYMQKGLCYKVKNDSRFDDDFATYLRDELLEQGFDNGDYICPSPEDFCYSGKIRLDYRFEGCLRPRLKFLEAWLNEL